MLLIGLNRASARADTPRNTAICSQSPAPKAVANSPASAPTANQTETSPTVTASPMEKARNAASQKIVIAIPPFDPAATVTHSYHITVPKKLPLDKAFFS